ncbi:MAG TPA: DUF362 domain-containing protein [Candidatus Saccharimonadales bacterium]|nr:DUF362 domain-containing protein [Candidatus Saccharimonadales bacterium]
MALLSWPLRGADIPLVGGPPARSLVVIVQDPKATAAFQAQPAVVQEMVNRGILALAAKADLKTAWRSFVSTQDIVGLKVFSGPGANSGTRPAVAAAVVSGLLQAGLAPSHIIIWDKHLLDLRLAGYDALASRYNIRLAGASDAGYDEKASYDNPVMGDLVAGDLEFDRDGKTEGRKSYVTKLLTGNITKIINITPLLNHNMAGVSGNLYGLAMGSMDNTLRFESSPDRLARAVPEIYALPALSDRVALNITDALLGQYQGEQLSLLHYSTELNQIWLSKDPVALDVLSLQELDRERQDRKIQSENENLGLYQNATLLELGVSDLDKIRLQMVK